MKVQCECQWSEDNIRHAGYCGELSNAAQNLERVASPRNLKHGPALLYLEPVDEVLLMSSISVLYTSRYCAPNPAS
jgi:hypothetical protein